MTVQFLWYLFVYKKKVQQIYSTENNTKSNIIFSTKQQKHRSQHMYQTYRVRQKFIKTLENNLKRTSDEKHF